MGPRVWSAHVLSVSGQEPRPPQQVRLMGLRGSALTAKAGRWPQNPAAWPGSLGRLVSACVNQGPTCQALPSVPAVERILGSGYVPVAVPEEQGCPAAHSHAPRSSVWGMFWQIFVE